MNPLVSILLGSISDRDSMKPCFDLLKEFNIPYEKKVISAHRAHDVLFAHIAQIEKSGIVCIIAAAGCAAHLAGAIAARTTLPVIGIPMPSPLNGLDSLYSTVQMPGGVPVATMAIGKAGAQNAAVFAAQILAVSGHINPSILKDYKISLRQKVLKDQELLDTDG